MSKEEKIAAFDASSYATNDNLFGLPFNYADSETIVLPVPWEVTVSYNSGTAQGPEGVKEASLQVDLYDPFLKDAWKKGIYMLEVNHELWEKSNRLRKKAEKYIGSLSDQTDFKDYTLTLEKINKGCRKMVKWVREQSEKLIEDNKRIVLLGGDHSTPLGLIQALADKKGAFGILQIDAHADLRETYEGFEYSHASIMYNALKLENVTKLVQVGIRDYSEGEVGIINQSNGRIKPFFDRDLKQAQYQGENWATQCREIIDELPPKVYLSFDIDGLDPKLCPNTGTSVAGGFETEEVLFLLERLVLSGREIIALDLNEIAPGNDEWDANVGARLLYRLCNIMAASGQ